MPFLFKPHVFLYEFILLLYIFHWICIICMPSSIVYELARATGGNSSNEQDYYYFNEGYKHEDNLKFVKWKSSFFIVPNRFDSFI